MKLHQASSSLVAIFSVLSFSQIAIARTIENPSSLVDHTTEEEQEANYHLANQSLLRKSIRVGDFEASLRQRNGKTRSEGRRALPAEKAARLIRKLDESDMVMENSVKLVIRSFVIALIVKLLTDEDGEGVLADNGVATPSYANSLWQEALSDLQTILKGGVRPEVDPELEEEMMKKLQVLVAEADAPSKYQGKEVTATAKSSLGVDNTKAISGIDDIEGMIDHMVQTLVSRGVDSEETGDDEKVMEDLALSLSSLSSAISLALVSSSYVGGPSTVGEVVDSVVNLLVDESEPTYDPETEEKPTILAQIGSGLLGSFMNIVNNAIP